MICFLSCPVVGGLFDATLIYILQFGIFYLSCPVLCCLVHPGHSVCPVLSVLSVLSVFCMFCMYCMYCICIVHASCLYCLSVQTQLVVIQAVPAYKQVSCLSCLSCLDINLCLYCAVLNDPNKLRLAHFNYLWQQFKIFAIDLKHLLVLILSGNVQSVHHVHVLECT